jgi:hypothetical protein
VSQAYRRSHTNDRYVDQFAALDIDAATLRHLTEAELRDELQVLSAEIHRPTWSTCARHRNGCYFWGAGQQRHPSPADHGGNRKIVEDW